jgi:hypothetical protein
MLKKSLENVKSFLTDKRTKLQKDLIDGFSQSDTSLNLKICQEICKDIKYISDTQIAKIGNDVYRDIEFFNNINDNTFKTKTIYDVLNNHSFIGSEEVSKQVLSKPLNSLKLLEDRQKIIQEVENKLYADSGKDDQVKIQDMAKLESDVLWLYQDLEQNIEDLYNIVYFRFSVLKPLNNYGVALSGWNIYKILVSPMIGILSPIIYFIVPFLVFKFKFKLRMSFISYLKLMYNTMYSQDFLLGGFSKYRSVKIVSYLFSMLFYFQGVFNSVEISRTLYKMAHHIVNRMNNVVRFLKDAHSLIQRYWNTTLIGSYVNKDNLSFIPNDEEEKYIKTLDVLDFSLFSNFGKQLSNYKFVDKEIISSILCKTYILDSIFSIVKAKRQHGLVYTKFESSIDNKPMIAIEGMWHPCIEKEKAIRNNLLLGQSKQRPNNAIITGTNAAGKSLLIKSLLVNVLLSQTTTLSVASSCALTPFTFINSQISIPDCTGHESLFQAEMHRCKSNLDSLRNLSNDKLALIIIDEIFNSTNPIEAIAGGFAICKKLATYNNSIMIFTTHFSYLTKLGKTGKFKNYKMETITNNGEIAFTYKLKEGINKHYIALELLKKEGFDTEIIDEAIALKNKLTK